MWNFAAAQNVIKLSYFGMDVLGVDFFSKESIEARFYFLEVIYNFGGFPSIPLL